MAVEFDPLLGGLVHLRDFLDDHDVVGLERDFPVVFVVDDVPSEEDGGADL